MRTSSIYFERLFPCVTLLYILISISHMYIQNMSINKRHGSYVQTIDIFDMHIPHVPLTEN